MMFEVGLGDVVFILLILGVIHGIMHWVTCLRRRRRKFQADAADG